MLKPSFPMRWNVEVGPLGEWLGHEGRVLMDGISTLKRRDMREMTALSTRWGHSKEALRNQEGGSHGARNLLHLDLGTSALQTLRNKCLLFKSPGLRQFVTVAQADEDTICHFSDKADGPICWPEEAWPQRFRWGNQEELCKFCRIEEHLSLVAVQVTSVRTSSKLDGDCHNIPRATSAFDATRGTCLLTKTSDVLQRIMQ